ncbi:hypothetical protein [Falsiroseomonas oryzae]|uniref:hypothetical protein n=1 Tax=Falsiroseomonas oryzae TaxID=2766473 RepID=UPI0022EB3884|nr:hypothetical protein [Roseomonas sp. MO-31]
MRLPLLLLLFALLLPGPATAQGQVRGSQLVECNPPGTARGTGSGFTTFETLAEFLNRSAGSLRLDGPVRQRATAVPTLEFSVARPPAIAPDVWRFGTWFEVVAYPADRAGGSLAARDITKGVVLPPAPDAERTTVVARFPALEQGWWPSRWEVVLLVCVSPPRDPGSTAEVQRAIELYAREPLFASTLRLSAASAVLVVLALYLALALAAMQVQRAQLTELRQRLGPAAPSALAYALRPTTIAQDSFGFASLSRFQILLFTLALTGVYAFVLMRTGELPTLSTSVLALLGITLTGSALARATEGSSVETANRIWLLGTGVLDTSPRIPAWSDLIASDGEIDASRVQALVFSLFAAVALVAFGTADLQNFAIPDELNYLITISQGAYVAGRALPRDSARRLNEEVRTIRDAETRVLLDPNDAAARTAFETARNALASSLLDVFAERFDDQRLRRLQPGERTPPPPPPPRA